MKSLLAVAALSFACAWSPAPVAQTPAAPQRPGAAQFKPEGPDAVGLSVRVVGALAAAALVALGAIYGLRRFAPWIAVPQAQPGEGSVRVVESLRLTQRLSLFVIEFGADRILLACTDGGVTVVSSAAPGEASRRRGEIP